MATISTSGKLARIRAWRCAIRPHPTMAARSGIRDAKGPPPAAGRELKGAGALRPFGRPSIANARRTTDEREVGLISTGLNLLFSAGAADHHALSLRSGNLPPVGRRRRLGGTSPGGRRARRAGRAVPPSAEDPPAPPPPSRQPHGGDSTALGADGRGGFEPRVPARPG